jgi:peroxiredoxin
MTEIKLTPSEIIITSEMYGGKYDQTITEMIAAGWVKSICISFPDLHAATSWASANDIEHAVNIVFHPIHFDEPVTVRFAFSFA